MRRRLQQGSSGQGLARVVQEVQGQVFTSLDRALQGVQGDTQVKGQGGGRAGGRWSGLRC